MLTQTAAAAAARRDFSNAYLARDMYTMLWHLSEGAGQRTTALPRYAAYHQPDERTMGRKEAVSVRGPAGDERWLHEQCSPDLRPFLPALFNKANFGDDACAIADCTFFDEIDAHYGTANASKQERSVVFLQFVPIGQPQRGSSTQQGAQQQQQVAAGSSK